MPIRLRYLLLMPLAVAAALLGLVRPAAAAFSTGASAAMSVTTATLTPPAKLSATTSCNIFGGSTVTITWAAAAAAATGYTAYLSANGGTPQAVSGSIKAGATSVTIPISNLVSYTMTLRTDYQSWTSAASAAPGTLWCL